MRLPCTHSARWLPLLFLLLAAATVAPIFGQPYAFASAYDWRYFESVVEAGRHTLAWYHQLPLWNPYGCGGEVLLANPQSMTASPLFVLYVLFGTALGFKLALVAYFFCALDGMYRLARDFALSPTGALLSSVLFATGGWLALHLATGHVNFASAALFPYLWLAYRRAGSDGRWAIPLGAVAAWMICDGGTATPAMATVLLFTLATIDAVAGRTLRPYGVLLAGAACAALLSGPRLLPTLEFAIDHPRRQWETDATTIWDMIRYGYWWRGAEPVAHKRYGFHEYGWRLSWITPPLILWSLRIKQTRSLWIVAAVAAGIVAGRALPYGPWYLLKHLPLFRDLRVPSRYTLLFALVFPLLCGAAWDDLAARFAAFCPRPLRGSLAAAGVALAAVAFVDGAAFDWFLLRDVFRLPLEVAAPGTRFHQVQGHWRVMLDRIVENHGVIGCDEEAPLQRAAAIDLGDVPQVRLADADAGAGRVLREGWTPNRVEADVALDRPATVLFNQNWNEHWKTTAGTIVKLGPRWPADRDGGRLAVSLPAGQRRFAVYYRPRSFVAGVVLSMVGGPLLVALLWWRRPRRRAPAGVW